MRGQTADIEEMGALFFENGHGRRQRLDVARQVWQAMAVAGLVAFALHAGLGVGGARADHFTSTWLYFGLEALAILALTARAVLVTDERAAWAWLAIGVTAYSLGDVAWQFNDYGAGPSIADVFYLLFYPASYIALLLLVRSRVSRFNRSVWLDGLTVALAVGAVGSAFLLEFALDHTEGDRLTVATNLAYPLGDVVLLALVVGVFWLVGRDAGLEWVVIAGALVATSIADAVYLWTATTGTYTEGGLVDILWPLMGIMLAAAAWVRPGRAKRVALEGRPLIATPIFCTVMALVVFAADHYRSINAAAVGLAALSIGIVLVRTVTTVRENGAITARIHLLSMTDPLTHLWNRRRLAADLAEVVGRADDAYVLVLYDLNGFKRFNDLFGHPAGDALLERLAFKFADYMRDRGTCYRLGGDEFCALARVPDGSLETFLDATAEALSERGDGFEVTTSYGCVLIPEEADVASGAMQLADQRLYTRKHHSLIERGQPHGVLLQALYEREPDLREHVSNVAELSVALGRRLGLDPPSLRTLELAAQLHDIGKLAIPDAILQKTAPLTVKERLFIEQHTVIGERILNAAPALSQTGVIVRATHEAYDGSGYPDGLAGASIPLAARIIAVCDTYAAVTASRPYQRERDHEEALAELRSAAGSRLDPDLVVLFGETFAQAVAVESPEPVPVI